LVEDFYMARIKAQFLGFLTILLIGTLFPANAFAQESPDMQGETTPEDGAENLSLQIAAAVELLSMIAALDEDADIVDNGATFTIDGITVTLVFDVRADRMRLISGITSDEGLEQAQLHRLMQANFDSALDARYAIAQGTVWSTFIHPLSSLTQDDFISGIAQTVTLVKTFGTTFTSGAFVFGGGDSNGELQKLLMEMLQDGEEI
jgi:hypothetical protein